MAQRRTAWLVGSLAVGLIVASVPLGAGLNPFDNDAGSGQDAGDIPSMALQIEPGAYAGTITNGVDPLDHYALDGERGQVLQFEWVNVDGGVGAVRLYTPDGRPYVHDLSDENPFRTAEEEVILHATGTWQLVFDANELSAGPSSYTFQVDLLEPPARAVGAGQNGPAGTIEARFDVPTDITVQGWVGIPVNATDAFTARWTATVSGTEHAGTDDARTVEGTLGFAVYKSRTGDTVYVTDDVSADLDLSVEEDADRIEWLNGRGFFDGFVGKVHSVSYRTTGDADVMVGAWAPAGIAAGGSSEDVLQWTNEDVAADQVVAAPGVSVVGPWERSLELDPSFNGIFSPGGAAAVSIEGGGSAQGPDGPAEQRPPGTFLLDQPAEGAWTLRSDGMTIGTGSRIFLSGAFTPDLGIWNGVLDWTG